MEFVVFKLSSPRIALQERGFDPAALILNSATFRPISLRASRSLELRCLSAVLGFGLELLGVEVSEELVFSFSFSAISAFDFASPDITLDFKRYFSKLETAFSLFPMSISQKILSATGFPSTHEK